jgi:hypothetical protein
MSLPLGPTSVLVNDVDAQNTPGNGLGDDNILAWLIQDIGTYNSNLGKKLAQPIDRVDSF